MHLHPGSSNDSRPPAPPLSTGPAGMHTKTEMWPPLCVGISHMLGEGYATPPNASERESARPPGMPLAAPQTTGVAVGEDAIT